MVQEICLAAEVEDIGPLLKEYRVPANIPVFMLVEMQPQHVIEPRERQNLLRFALFEHSFAFAGYTSGRVFHQHGELRWERQQGTFQVVYTGQEAYKPDLEITAHMLLDDCQQDFRRYLLFGKRLADKELNRIGPAAQAGDFAEVRIPRLLLYPAPQDAQRVRMVVCEYREPASGQRIAFRFTDLKE